MPAFIAIAALLASIVLLLVLRPLWGVAPRSTAALGGMLLLFVALLYRLLGTPAALDPAMRQAPATLVDAVTQLEAALRRDPNQPEGWRLLGRAYASARQPGKAREAFARAAVLAPDRADVLVEAAEASALADPQRHFDAKAVALLQHALQVQPQEQRARWFLGIALRQAEKPAAAAKTWEPLLAEVDAKTAVPLRAQIDAARRDAGLAPLPPQPAASSAIPHDLTVTVKLDPGIAARIRVNRDASVFVIARMPDGPPMPIAVEKHGVREVPFTATLDDSDGPMPMQKLSAMQDVEVIARVSMSGNPMPQPGDLESAAVRVHLPASKAIELTIGAVRR